MNNELKIKAYHFASWKTGSAPLPTDDASVKRIADATGWMNDMVAVLDHVENVNDEVMVRNAMIKMMTGVMTSEHLIFPTAQAFSDRSDALPYPGSVPCLARLRINSETERHSYPDDQGAMRDIQLSLKEHNEFIEIATNTPQMLETLRFWQHLHLYGILITCRSANASLMLRSNLGVADFQDLVQLNVQRILN